MSFTETWQNIMRSVKYSMTVVLLSSYARFYSGSERHVRNC